MNRTDFDSLLTAADAGDNDAINKIHDVYATITYLNNNFTAADVAVYQKQPIGPYSLHHIALLIYMFNHDIVEFKKYLLESVDQKCSQSYVLLAYMIDHDIMEHDATFEELIDAAIKMKNSNAYIELGLKTTNEKKKIKLLKKAIKLGNRNAIHELGLHYHDTKNYDMAVKYYRRSIDSGAFLSHFNLAVMHREGEGVLRDTDKALQLFHVARENGCNRAATAIGSIFYERGDEDTAQQYFMEAIANGDPMACYNFGHMHKQRGNIFEAMRCFVEGTKRGSDSCKRELVRFGVINFDLTDAELKQHCDLFEMVRHFGANDYY